jgi:hypothetical protein
LQLFVFILDFFCFSEKISFKWNFFQVLEKKTVVKSFVQIIMSAQDQGDKKKKERGGNNRPSRRRHRENRRNLRAAARQDPPPPPLEPAGIDIKPAAGESGSETDSPQ